MLKIKLRKAVCPICHNEMDHKILGRLLQTANDKLHRPELKVWLCPQCHYWIPTNPSGDGALLYRESNLRTIKSYSKWSDEVFQIMKDKFWEKWDKCNKAKDTWCVLWDVAHHNHCGDCGNLFPNEQGIPIVMINTKWLKKVKTND